VSRSVGAAFPTYQTFCSSSPVSDPTGRTGAYSIDQAFLNAWLQINSNGACKHLATYSTEEEFNAIVQSILTAGGTSSVIGGRRFSSSDYQWGTGTIRGQNWIEPFDATTGGTVGRASCLQAFCLRDMANAQPITNVNQVGMSIVVTNQLNPLLVPSSGADCYTVEINAVSFIASVDGGQPLEIIPALANFDTHQSNAILASKYLARVSSATQNQWIKDELQCAPFSVWLGYETSTLTTDLRLSAGPNEGMIIEPAGSTACVGYYCNLGAGMITLKDAAAKFASATGDWSMALQSTTASGLREYDICSTANGVPVCVPQASNNWLQYMTASAASRQTQLGLAFYAGSYYQKTISGVYYLYYFDCFCRTDYRVNLACLGGPNPGVSCTIYNP